MGVRPTDSEHRPTMFELLFDLVYVFAATQVTAFMSDEHSAMGVIDGLLVIGLLWWTWAAYTWLGNQARADEGLLRAGMALATVAIFVVGLAVPETFDDVPGGLYGPMVVVVAYLLVRVIHLAMYSFAAGDDAGLRHQVAISWLPLAASAVLLIVGALVGGVTQTILFAVALFGEWLGVYLTSRNGSWRVHSVSHWTERYGLFVIIAIGESIVAIGSGAATSALTASLLTAAVLGVVIAICLWWLYFDVVAIAAEEAMREADDARRLTIALEGYTYGHFALIAGILLAALGVELSLEVIDDGASIGGFAAVVLLGGLGLHLLGHVWFKARVLHSFSGSRTIGTVALVATMPLVAALRSVPALLVPTVILAAVVVWETVHHGETRRRLRGVS